MIQNWRSYFVVFQGINYFNAEKERKNETKCISHSLTDPNVRKNINRL
jgi:hypothetical protein